MLTVVYVPKHAIVMDKLRPVRYFSYALMSVIASWRVAYSTSKGYGTIGCFTCCLWLAVN